MNSQIAITPTKRRDIKSHRKNTNLSELRKASTQKIVEFLDQHKSELVTIQEINESLFKEFEESKELKLSRRRCRPGQR